MHLSFQSYHFTLGIPETSQYHSENISLWKVIGTRIEKKCISIKKEMYFCSVEHRTNEKYTSGIVSKKQIFQYLPPFYLLTGFLWYRDILESGGFGVYNQNVINKLCFLLHGRYLSMDPWRVTSFKTYKKEHNAQ